MLIDALLTPQIYYAHKPLSELPPEILREHLLRAMLAAHLAQRTILPMERLPALPAESTRLLPSASTLVGLGDWLNNNLSSNPASIGRYGALLVYAITLWRAWRQERLPCSSGSTLLAPHELFIHQDLEDIDPYIPTWRRTYRVQISSAGCRPLRERWESAPAKAYREPITHAEVLDGLTFVIENELLPLKWTHILPWSSRDVVRPLSARAATERRAPRLWLFPLRPSAPELTLHATDKSRPWTNSFTVNHTRSKAEELREIVRLLKTEVKAGQDLSRDLLVFPELSLGEGDIAELRAELEQAGLNPALLIAGSHHRPSQTTTVANPSAPMLAEAPVYGDGEREALWRHQKRGPFRVTKKQWEKVNPAEANLLPNDAEIWEQITPGNTFTTFDGPGGRVGVLICADLLEERFPAMRDLVRISHVDLLIVVNFSPKTTLFMRHAEQLNRLGVCAVFLNATIAVLSADPDDLSEADPFTALLALPQLTLAGDARVPTWFLWRHTDQTLLVQTKEKWKSLPSQSLTHMVREFKARNDSPAAILIDLNAWLAGPEGSASPNDPVMIALGSTIQTALTNNTIGREDRVAALRAEEKNVLPTIAGSLTDEARARILDLHESGLFEPTAAEYGDTLKNLFALRLARPHRLAVPPERSESEGEAQTGEGKAESHFIVSLTPLGEALACWLLSPQSPPPPERSSRLSGEP